MKKQLISFMFVFLLIFQMILTPVSSIVFAVDEENIIIEDSNEHESIEEDTPENEIKPEENKQDKLELEKQEEPEVKEVKEVKEEKKPEESKTKEEIKKDENRENQVVPVEEEISKSSGKVKTYSNNKELANNKAESASHVIKPVETDNMCLREVEGTIDINLPAPTEKKPIDIVVVQDASGSYSGNENQVKQSLKDIVNMLDLNEDRMMVTSYRGYSGFKAYRNESQYPNNSDGDQGIGNQQKLTTTNHTQLTNNETRLTNGINSISFGGATPTASGLKFAREEYARLAGSNLNERETVFILITDGVANAMLDGYIHVDRSLASRITNVFQERYQMYNKTFAEVVGEAEKIKAPGYEVISAYWENTRVLQNAYVTSYYNNTIGPAARQMLRNVASSKDNYSQSEDLAQLISDLLANLQTTINQYSGFQAEFDLAPGFELVEDSVLLNGNQVTANQTGNKVAITANRIRSGESKLTYKLKETEVHGNETRPMTNGLVSYDKVSGKFTKTINISSATLKGNPNSATCEVNVKKFVALNDSTEFTDSVELDKINDAFTYKLDYQFDEKIGTYDSVQLKDELESVLELVGTKNDISIESANIQNLNSTISLLNNKSGFTIDIEKKNNSYNYLAGKKITVTFQAKIKDKVTKLELESYPDKKIPNEAILLLDGKAKTSPKVFVTPPKQGTLKINKVDAANANVKLQGAKFEILDSKGNRVGELTTGSDGTAISKELPAGKYILVEKEAPSGYEIETTDLTVTIEKGKQTIKTISNKQLKGKVVITKVDDGENLLEGATFELLDSNGKTVETKTSDSKGEIVFENLDWGEYSLKETKAPEGYRLLSKEIKLTIDKENLLIRETIKNTKQGWNLPNTGGIGTLGFYGLGILLMTLAVWFIFRKRKSN